MHDIHFIRENPIAFTTGLARRSGSSDPAEIISTDKALRSQITAVQEMQAARKRLSEEFGKIVRSNGSPPTTLVSEIEMLKANIPSGEIEVARLQERLKDLLSKLPNIPADDVPPGEDEEDNVTVFRWGAPRNFSFPPKEHADFALPLGLDFETAQRVSGSRFAYLRGSIARLNRALGQFMLDMHTISFGYTEVNPPLLVRDEAMYGTGQLPKFTYDQFSSADIEKRGQLFWEALPDFNRLMAEVARTGGDFKKAVEEQLELAPTREDFWLIPTAEVSLTNMVREKILAERDLPLRFVALTPCFRAEAGSAGRDTRGLIRQHQFEKVELVSIASPDESKREHERMTNAAESVLQRLELPYRKMLLCAGDMGFSANKTYDLEVWLPGQSKYREISSCSNCGDFQARRMNTRFRREGVKGNEFVHTLNGSGLAVGRTLVAILENYQQADGSVTIPEALLPYMGGITKLEPTN